MHALILPMLLLSLGGADSSASDSSVLVRVGRMHGGLSPKSIAWNGHGLFFAQNMMYRHTVAVFNDEFQRCGTITDRVALDSLGFCDRTGGHRGAPVECVFTADGRYAFVSNYAMEGDGFSNPGCDGCHGSDLDGSFVYRINASTLRVEAAYPTGSVPKFLALTPDERHLLVSNWSSGDVSIIDLVDPGCSERIPVGRFPRGLAIDPGGRFAYVAIMGGSSIERIDLLTRSVEHFATVGRGPRHLCLDSTGNTLYASLNHEGAIVKVDVATKEVSRLHVGGSPRSMVFGRDERSLYVVHYSAARISKVSLDDFTLADAAITDSKPIGITYDARNNRVWVACYSGSILVFEDRDDARAVNVARAPCVDVDSCAALAEIQGNTKHQRNVAIAPRTTHSRTPAVHARRYLVVTGAFRDPANAQRQAERLRGLGYDASIRETGTGRGLLQVVAGTFAAEEEAMACKRKLAAKAVDGWVKRP